MIIMMTSLGDKNMLDVILESLCISQACSGLVQAALAKSQSIASEMSSPEEHWALLV